MFVQTREDAFIGKNFKDLKDSIQIELIVWITFYQNQGCSSIFFNVFEKNAIFINYIYACNN